MWTWKGRWGRVSQISIWLHKLYLVKCRQLWRILSPKPIRQNKMQEIANISLKKKCTLSTKCFRFWQRNFSGHSYKNQTCLTAGTLEAFYLFELPPFSFKVKYEGFGSDWKSVFRLVLLLVFFPILFRWRRQWNCD